MELYTLGTDKHECSRSRSGMPLSVLMCGGTPDSRCGSCSHVVSSAHMHPIRLPLAKRPCMHWATSSLFGVSFLGIRDFVRVHDGIRQKNCVLRCAFHSSMNVTSLTLSCKITYYFSKAVNVTTVWAVASTFSSHSLAMSSIAGVYTCDAGHAGVCP